MENFDDMPMSYVKWNTHTHSVSNDLLTCFPSRSRSTCAPNVWCRLNCRDLTCVDFEVTEVSLNSTPVLLYHVLERQWLLYIRSSYSDATTLVHVPKGRCTRTSHVRQRTPCSDSDKLELFTSSVQTAFPPRFVSIYLWIPFGVRQRLEHTIGRPRSACLSLNALGGKGDWLCL